MIFTQHGKNYVNLREKTKYSKHMPKRIYIVTLKCVTRLVAIAQDTPTLDSTSKPGKTEPPAIYVNDRPIF